LPSSGMGRFGALAPEKWASDDPKSAPIAPETAWRRAPQNGHSRAKCVGKPTQFRTPSKTMLRAPCRFCDTCPAQSRVVQSDEITALAHSNQNIGCRGMASRIGHTGKTRQNARILCRKHISGTAVVARVTLRWAGLALYEGLAPAHAE
jgi:hypothetical protein